MSKETSFKRNAFSCFLIQDKTELEAMEKVGKDWPEECGCYKQSTAQGATDTTTAENSEDVFEKLGKNSTSELED